jgi:hypothetical protein
MRTVWEYRFVHAVDDAGECRVVSIDDDPTVGTAEPPVMSAYANALGAEGWELVTAAYADYELGSVHRRVHFIFRRTA